MLQNILRGKIFKFIVSGGTSALVNFSVLYFLTDWFGVYYLFSSIVSFVFGVLVGFIMQKFWTFKDTRKDNIKKQAWIYFFVAIVNVGLNTLFVYFLVEYAKLHYLLAQFVSNIVLALESFFVYKKVIFKAKKEQL